MNEENDGLSRISILNYTAASRQSESRCHRKIGMHNVNCQKLIKKPINLTIIYIGMPFAPRCLIIQTIRPRMDPTDKNCADRASIANELSGDI